MKDVKVKIITEGQKGNLDYIVIEKLIEKEGLKKECFKIEASGNKEDVKAYLETLNRSSDFDVCLVVIDLDEENKKNAFKEIIAKTEEKKFNIPSGVGEITKPEKGKKGLGVFLLPDNENQGSMDTLAYNCIKNQYQKYDECVEEMLECLAKKGFKKPKTENQRSKFHYQVLMGGLMYKNESRYKFLDFNNEALAPLKRFLKKTEELD